MLTFLAPRLIRYPRAFIRIWRNVGRYEDRRALLAWLSCDLRGHVWIYDCWSEDVGLNEPVVDEWWLCRRCNDFTRANPNVNTETRGEKPL